MAATGVYWKPVWDVLEGHGFSVLLANPAHIKNVPGRKTDVNDATWIAQLLECGLLQGSFVPPVQIRQLREITRYRRQLVEERSREVQRLQKLLEDAGVKLSSVASQVLGVTGRAMLEALIDGERDPAVLAALAKGKLRPKSELLARSVPGRFNSFHATMARELLDHIDYLDLAVARPGNNESAGKHKSTGTRSGNPWLTSALVEAAWAAIRTKDCYLAIRFQRIRKRRGEQRALIAIAHTLLVICWHIPADDTIYNEIGTDYLAARHQPEPRRRHLVAQLEQLGYTVELAPVA